MKHQRDDCDYVDDLDSAQRVLISCMKESLAKGSSAFENELGVQAWLHLCWIFTIPNRNLDRNTVEVEEECWELASDLLVVSIATKRVTYLHAHNPYLHISILYTHVGFL